MEKDVALMTVLSEIIKLTRESVFVFNREGLILYANDAAYEETEYPDFSGKNITAIYPMALHHGRNGVTWQAGEIMHTFAYRMNKTCYPVKLTCFPLEATERETIVAFAINDSERYNAVRSHKKAMESVEEADKMKNEFTANITHELRTPINGIKGMAEGLMTTQLDPRQEETVGIILRCCDNMTKIINDILDFSKIEAGKIEIVNAEFSLNKFLKDQLAFHSAKTNEKGLKLIVNVSGSVPDKVIGDELRLGQILNNLFSNAIKFTSQGQIAMELTANKLENDEIELFFLIIDTGIGISDEEKDKLFKSFSQVDGSITRRFGGTGLGLAITKQLVTLMGGKISVDSEKGKGSTFSFTVKVKVSRSAGSVNFPEGRFEYSGNVPTAKPVLPDADDNVYEAAGSIPDLLSAYSDDEDNAPLFAESVEDETEMRIRENLEKLLICMELESWEKAEGFATVLRNMIGEHKPELKSKAFSLLLNVRKEKYELAMAGLRELGEVYGI